jgi:hypothetical protein
MVMLRGAAAASTAPAKVAARRDRIFFMGGGKRAVEPLMDADKN